MENKELRFFEIKVFIPYSNSLDCSDGSYTFYSSEGYDFEDVCSNLVERLKHTNIIVCYQGYDDENNWVEL